MDGWMGGWRRGPTPLLACFLAGAEPAKTRRGMTDRQDRHTTLLSLAHIVHHTLTGWLDEANTSLSTPSRARSEQKNHAWPFSTKRERRGGFGRGDGQQTPLCTHHGLPPAAGKVAKVRADRTEPAETGLM